MSKKLFRSHDDDDDEEDDDDDEEDDDDDEEDDEDDDEEDDDAAQTNKSLPRANFYASRWFRFPEDHEQCDQIG